MPVKTVVVEATAREKYKLESKLGNHTIYIDQPMTVGGTDAGPTPLEIFLLSLAGCISAIGRIVADQKRIALHGMAIRVEGTINTDTLLGKSAEGRIGFPSIEAVVDVDADLSPEEKKAFLAEVKYRCPVSDNMSNTTAVTVRLKE